MHELSISQTIAKTVLEKASEQKARNILFVEIEIGELTLLNPEQVEFWLEEIFKKTPAKDAKIQIRKIHPQMKCQDCQWQGKIKGRDDPRYHTYFFNPPCPSCGSTSLDIKKGKECLIKRITISHR